MIEIVVAGCSCKEVWH